jgi:hypothetical protein
MKYGLNHSRLTTRFVSALSEVCLAEPRYLRASQTSIYRRRTMPLMAAGSGALLKSNFASARSSAFTRSGRRSNPQSPHARVKVPRVPARFRSGRRRASRRVSGMRPWRTRRPGRGHQAPASTTALEIPRIRGSLRRVTDSPRPGCAAGVIVTKLVISKTPHTETRKFACDASQSTPAAVMLLA